MREKLRNYFTENLTAYSYLFFAQVLAIIVNVYLKYQGQHPPAKALVSVWKWENSLIIFLPFIFILAAIVTVDFSRLQTSGKIIAFCVNFFLFAVVIFYCLFTPIFG
jgi:hypothetical protein